jgi:hypothetical protein
MKIFTVPLSTAQLVDVQTLHGYLHMMWHELTLTRTDVSNSRITGSPFPYGMSGRANGGVINTLHAAATAVDGWYARNGQNFEPEETMNIRMLLDEIKSEANKEAIITDPYEGEDDSQHFLAEWIEIVRLFGVSIKHSRLARLRGDWVKAPDFLIYPPRRLLTHVH